MTDKNALLVEEQALHEQEQGLVQMEAQLHTQEQGVAQMERAFQKKNKALLNLASYVKEQEASLMRRAESMGPRAKQLAFELLAKSEGQGGQIELDLGKLDDRVSLLQKRRDLMSSRMSLIEEREALYAARAESLERAESQVTELEQKLVRRETEVSDVARKVFSASSTLLEEDDEEGDPAPAPVSVPSAGLRDEQPRATTASFARPEVPKVFVPASQAVGAAPAAPSPGEVKSAVTSQVIAGEAVRVESGAVERDDDGDDDGVGGGSRADDKATRKRASARARVRTNQFKITLEAHLDAGEPHHFFRYENDGAADLPGLFIATPNLLKVGREVRIRVGRQGQYLEATGIVAWRRQRGDAGGVPGMGIELLNLSEPERGLVAKWIKDKAPVTI